MIIHYNIYPDKDYVRCQHIVWFYFGDCSPVDMIALVPYIQSIIDKSIGRIFYSDWDWSSQQGTVRLQGTCGCTQEILITVCDKVIGEIREIMDIDPCKYCPKKK